MKVNRIIRSLSIALILSLLVVVLPASPVWAAEDISLDPDEGKIGDRIDITGDDFTPSTYDPISDTWTYKNVSIYFSSEEVDVGDEIDDELENYERVRASIEIDEDGELDTYFNVPDTLNDGDEEEDVSPGTYYVYVTYYGYDNIEAMDEFTVVAAEIDLTPDRGQLGTEVEITGINFSDSEEITIEYDGEEVDIASGDTETDSDGDFECIIIITEGSAGTHTITVTDESDIEAEAEFTIVVSASLSATEGKPGSEILVSGSGFIASGTIVIYFDNTSVGTDTTNAYGSFSTSFITPAAASGTHTVIVSDGTNEATFDFSITINMQLDNTTGHVGTTITIYGIGFLGAVSISYDGAVVATTNVQTDGSFLVTFDVPISEHGAHLVTATDGVSTLSSTFTMESTPPPIPQPLLPTMGAKAKAEAYFDWEDVTDKSLPITYTLQIATDDNFTSLVLEKEGLINSEYTITQEERLQSVPKEAPYYWRLRAVDSASNESGWTGAGSFYVGFVFNLPPWGLYSLIGVGGLLLFFVGIWLGRRTSYY